MTTTPDKIAHAAVRVLAAVSEPRHKGDHLAVVSPADARRLGVAEALEDAELVHVRLLDPVGGGVGYARVYASSEVAPGAVDVEGYILANCGAEPGAAVLLEAWDRELDARPADVLTLTVVEGETFGVDGPELLRQARQRLSDCGLTLAPGHRFLLPIGPDGPLMFRVEDAVADGRTDGGPVYCTPQTDVEIVGAGLGDGVVTTAAPEPEEGVFEEIGGLEAAIQKIVELVIWPAEQPGLFARLGIRTARGIILYGPPGSGKTLLARAVARRLGARFFAVNGPEIVSKFYGESEQRLRKVFQDAAREQPSVVFLDEIDSIAPSRENVSGDLEVRLVSQLLTLLDGLADRGQVVVIAATNRPGAIDPALRRPGRFDHEVEIAPPDPRGRREIMRVHTRSMPLAGDVDLDGIAERTVGFVGADLASLCQEAALAAARRTFAGSGGGTLDGAALAAVAVSQADFVEGLRTVQPSAFRELQQPPTGPAWDEIVGLREAKRALTELVDWPMSQRARLEELGIGRGGGILLCGPALSGKTALVAALARRLAASLVYLPSVNLLSPWIGTSEQLVRDAFVKARNTSPSIVLIDGFEQLVAAGPELAHRVLAQVGNELTRLSHSVPAFVVIAARDDEPLPAGVLRDPLLSDVVRLAPPTAEEVLEVLRGRLGTHTVEAPLEDVARRLAGVPVGKVLRVCHEVLTAALWDGTGTPVIRQQHVEAALARSGVAR